MDEILAHSYSTEDKNEIRTFFNRLRQLLLDWHTTEFGSEQFEKQEERIRNFYQLKSWEQAV